MALETDITIVMNGNENTDNITTNASDTCSDPEKEKSDSEEEKEKKDKKDKMAELDEVKAQLDAAIAARETAEAAVATLQAEVTEKETRITALAGEVQTVQASLLDKDREIVILRRSAILGESLDEAKANVVAAMSEDAFTLYVEAVKKNSIVPKQRDNIVASHTQTPNALDVTL